VNALIHSLPLLLLLCACAQGGIAILNFFLNRLMRWESAIAAMPLLVRQVFIIHGWFIGITLGLFATLTWRFGPELHLTALGRWLAGGIAIFWGTRTVLQITFYSAEHWRGQPLRIVIHLVLLGLYGGFTLVYGATAAGF
jgi:hypothetical protein